jgi:hypothetical protein
VLGNKNTSLLCIFVLFISLLFVSCASKRTYITSSPPGATITLQVEYPWLSSSVNCFWTVSGSKSGTKTVCSSTPCSIQTFGSFQGECIRLTRNYTASKRGFKSVTISGDDIKKLDRYHFILPELETIKITRSISSEPEGANIFMGNQMDNLANTGFKTPHSFEMIGTDPWFPSTYIQVRQKAYQDSEIKLLPGKKTSDEVRFKLKAARKYTINTTITSEPGGARIYVGSKKDELLSTSKETPYTFSFSDYHSEAPDQYYQVIKEGYNPSEVKYLNKRSNHEVLHFSLKEIQFGYLKLTTNEKLVDVYLDGKLESQIKDKPFVKKVSAGNHTIMVKKRFFKPETIQVSVSENGVFEYHFELVKASGWQEDKPGTSTVVQGKGDLTVLTGHDDFVVYIDGVKKPAPFVLKNIAAGLYELRIVGPGIDKVINQIVNDGDKIIIDLDKNINR